VAGDAAITGGVPARIGAVSETGAAGSASGVVVLSIGIGGDSAGAVGDEAAIESGRTAGVTGIAETVSAAAVNGAAAGVATGSVDPVTVPATASSKLLPIIASCAGPPARVSGGSGASAIRPLA
jgi:hypothetical protein